MIVVDASVFVSAIVDDEDDFVANHIYDSIIRTSENVFAPPIFYYETANVFLKIFNRNRINIEKYNQCLELLFDFPVVIDAEQSVIEVANLAKIYGLTVYDAAYLEVAKRNRFSLATLDKQLVSAALKANVKLELNHA